MITLDAEQVDILLTILNRLDDADVEDGTEGYVRPEDLQDIFDDLHDAWTNETGEAHPEQEGGEPFSPDPAEQIAAMLDDLAEAPDGTMAIFQRPTGELGVIHPMNRSKN